MNSFFTEVIHPAWDMLGIGILVVIGLFIFIGNIVMLVAHIENRGKKSDKT